MDSCKCTSAIGNGFTKKLHSNGCSTSLGGFTQDFVDTHLVREKKDVISVTVHILSRRALFAILVWVTLA